MKTITISNQKGGVAKTTTSLNMAVDLARHGKRVLVLDIDSQANGTGVLLRDPDIRFEKNIGNIIIKALSSQGVLEVDDRTVLDNVVQTKYKNLDMIPSVSNLSTIELQLLTSQILEKDKIISNIVNVVDNDYDYVIVDCPPSLYILTLSALISADLVIVPTDLDKFGMDGTETTIAYIKKLGLDYRLLITKYSDLVSEREFLENADYLKENRLENKVRFQKKFINEQFNEENNFAVENDNINNNVGIDIKNVVDEILLLDNVSLKRRKERK